MNLRLTPGRCVPLALLLAAGCLYPVREKIDFTVCELAGEPRDVRPTPADQTPPVMPPAVNGESKPKEVQQTAYRPDEGAVPIAEAGSPIAQASPGGTGTPQKPGTGETGKEFPPGKGPALKGTEPPTRPEGLGPQRQLTIPGELLPTGTPPVAPLSLPPPTPENQAARRQMLERLYAPLPPLGPDPQPLPGPEGRPLTLSDLQRIGLAHSPAVKQAVAAVEGYRGAAIQAGLPPNPTIGYEGDTAGTTGGAGYQGGFIDQVIKTANKLQLARAVATFDWRNAEVALRRAEMDLATNVRRYYFALLVARESMRVNRALVQFTTQVYEIQAAQAKGGGFAAPYEPLYLETLSLTARTNLVQARNAYVQAWKNLAAAMGMPLLPLTEVEGRVDLPMPVFDYNEVLNHVLKNHTDVLTAQNSLAQAKLNVRVAQVTPIPDIELRFMLQKDYTGPPFEVAHSVQVNVPIPVWNRNQGGIIQAEANLISASEQPHLVAVNLSSSLNTAFAAYQTNVTNLAIYRNQILPNLVRVYQGIYQRYQRELIGGGGVAGVPGFATPTLNDIVVAQGNLSGAVAQYVTILGQAWDAAVNITDLLQTNDMFGVTQKLQPVGPVPELPPLPCCHPCLPFKAPIAQAGDTTWPPALPGPGEPRMPLADEPRGRPGTAPAPGGELLPEPKKLPEETPAGPPPGGLLPPAGPELNGG
jgi:cobalt-zinc-cadmium efflux system outer membrane protein